MGILAPAILNRLCPQVFPLFWYPENVAAIHLRDVSRLHMEGNKQYQVRICEVPKEVSSRMATDPVCLAIVDEDDAKITTTYKNQKYYFCCNYCKKQFEENPKRYARISHDVSVDLGSCT